MTKVAITVEKLKEMCACKSAIRMFEKEVAGRTHVIDLDTDEFAMYLIDKGVEHWLGWCVKNDLIRQTVLSNKSFNNSLMYKPNFSWMDITNTTFDNSRLTEAGALHAKFQGCSFAHAEMQSASMFFTTMSDCNLSEAVMDMSSLNSMAFSVTKMNTMSANKVSITKSGFEYGDLCYAQFSRAFMNKVVFSRCRMINTNLYAATLVDVDISNSSLDGSSFAKAKLSGVRLTKSTFKGNQFAGASLSDVKFDRCKLYDFDFSGATLVDVSFENMKVFDGVKFTGAKLTRVAGVPEEFLMDAIVM